MELVENGTFSFLQSWFSRFWMPFPRKHMKTLAVFIIYFHFKVHFKSYTFCQFYCLNIFSKKCRLVQLNITFSKFQLLFGEKNMTRSTNSMTYFDSSFRFVHAYELWPSKIFCQKCWCSLKMLTNCYIILQLWALFVTKHIKRSTIFMTYSQSSSQITVTYSQGSRYLQTASVKNGVSFFRFLTFSSLCDIFGKNFIKKYHFLMWVF